MYIILINNTFTMSNTESRKALFTKFIGKLAEIIIEDDKKRLADNEKRLADEQHLENEFNQLKATATANANKPRSRHVATKDPGIV